MKAHNVIKVPIPHSVEIAGFTYSIEANGQHSNDLMAKNCWGDCANALRRIRLDVGLMSPDQLRNTFLHELLEAINVLYCNESLNHRQLTNVGNGLAQVLKSIGIEFVWQDKGHQNEQLPEAKD
jgi:hypothetical protein